MAKKTINVDTIAQAAFDARDAARTLEIMVTEAHEEAQFDPRVVSYARRARKSSESALDKLAGWVLEQRRK